MDIDLKKTLEARTRQGELKTKLKKALKALDSGEEESDLTLLCRSLGCGFVGPAEKCNGLLRYDFLKRSEAILRVEEASGSQTPRWLFPHRRNGPLPLIEVSRQSLSNL